MDHTKEFLTWLSPTERRAHELGALMLGTSYDPVKTHGYQKYLEAMRQKMKAGHYDKATLPTEQMNTLLTQWGFEEETPEVYNNSKLKRT